ncbi:MAG: hypothetical protein ACFE9L_09175 [Candidatus Hodarchaeota archaeon]
MESGAIFWTKCTKCDEFTGVEICQNCLTTVLEKGINLQGELEDEERTVRYDHNISYFCDPCRRKIENALCDECLPFFHHLDYN